MVRFRWHFLKDCSVESIVAQDPATRDSATTQLLRGKLYEVTNTKVCP